jgi:hypothetical protein
VLIFYALEHRHLRARVRWDQFTGSCKGRGRLA